MRLHGAQVLQTYTFHVDALKVKRQVRLSQ